MTELVSGDAKENQVAMQWACQWLSSHGYLLKSELPEEVVKTPWSYVGRFLSSEGSIYLKQTPVLLALETRVIQILQDKFHAPVVSIIAENSEHHCFLMKDAGQSLRSILKQAFNTPLFCKAIDQFTLLQLATAENLDIFLDGGVPDWRLHQLPGLYNDLLLQEDILLEDGLTEAELMQLKALVPKVSHLCEQLSDYPIKQTIVQPDFNDNNTIIDNTTQRITIIDLGEIVISHPFFSLVNCLKQLEKHHELTVFDEPYVQIKEACLKNYIHLGSEKDVLEAFEIARQLWPVYWILAEYRLMMACGRERLRSFQSSRLVDSMKAFLLA